MKIRCTFFGLLLTACGGAKESPAPGNTTTPSDVAALTPGAAGTGHLAYLVETKTGRELEITNLTTAKVEYRSKEADGEVGHFFLSSDGSTAVFRTAAKPCTRVRLPEGTTSDCTPPGVMLAYLVGLSGDGSKIGFTALDGTTFKETRVIMDGSTATFLGDAPEDSGQQVTGGGALSPDGSAFYEFRYGSDGTNPQLALWKYVDGSAPEAVFEFSAGVRAHSIQDLKLQLSEDGTRGLFVCIDEAQTVPAERVSACTIALATATVVRYPNAVGSLSLDGSALVTVPFIGEKYRVYPFGSTTPSATIDQPGGSVTLSPDASRLGFRLRSDGVFFAAATRSVADGVPVLVQRDRPTARAVPEYLLWRR